MAFDSANGAKINGAGLFEGLDIDARKLGIRVAPGVVLHEPKQRGDGRWVVAIEDPVLGDRAEKDYPNKERALDFYTQLWLGKTRAEQALGDDAPGLAVNERLQDNIKPGKQVKESSKKGKVNLRAVAEVLAEHGLDPSEEIAAILTEVEEVQPDGTVVKRHQLPTMERGRVLLELMQYVHPKLKATELKVDGKLSTDLPMEAVDARIRALIAKAAGT